MAPKRKSDGTEPQRKSARLRSDAPDAPGPAKPKAEKKPAAAKKASPAPATSASDHKKESGSVPEVTLTNEDEEKVVLKDVLDKSGIVLFSYPKANTGGCTTQACGYRDIYADIQKEGFEVYGISTDSPKSLKSWKTSKNFQYHLLSDKETALLSKIGWTQGKKRCHWVIEKGGKILESALGVKPADDPTNALSFIQGLSKK